jgi:hypothetical protein
LSRLIAGNPIPRIQDSAKTLTRISEREYPVRPVPSTPGAEHRRRSRRP